MAVAAARNSTLTQEFNLPTSDMKTPDPNTVLNKLYKATDDSIKDSSDFLTETQSGIEAQTTAAVDTDGVTRTATDLQGTIKDLKKLNTGELNSEISGMIPNPMAKSAFNKLSSQCQSKFSSSGTGKPWDISGKCKGQSSGSGSSSSCNNSEVNDLLNKLSGGAYNSTFNDLNQILKNLIALSKYGINAGLCGVFGALAGSFNANSAVSSRALGSLLGTTALTQNASGFMNLASSSAGLHPLLENPGAITDNFNSFAVPDEITEGEYGDFAERFDGGAEMLDDSWDVSDFDGSESIACITDGTEDLSDSYNAWATESLPDLDNLDMVQENEACMKAAALDSQQMYNPNIDMDLLSQPDTGVMFFV